MTSSETIRFKELLKANGHQITKAREATFRLLLNAEPQTVNEIIMKSGGVPDRVSIYRNLELFERLGIAHRLYVGWKYKIELSDEFTHHHHHLSCLGCGKTIVIDDESHIDQFIDQLAARFDFAPRRHQFEVDGYCADCRARS